MRGMRAAAGLLMLASLAAQAQAPTALSSTEQAQLRQAVAEADAARSRGDRVACHAVLARQRALALRDWGVAAQRWWNLELDCAHAQDLPTEAQALERELARRHAPMRAHFLQPPAGVTVDPTGQAMARFGVAWWLVGTDAERADALELAEVQALRARADAAAQAELRGWARLLYGRAHGLERWERRLREWYGEGHEITLRAKRAQAFYARRMARHDEALAHIEEAMARWQRHQSHDPRLRVMLVSERAGCYANVGRFAEAREDLLFWRDQQLAETPRHEGNLMRAHYNLASLSITMGDVDAAVAFAEASVAHGMRSEDPIDRNEARLPRVLRERARLLRGDAEAPAALARLLREFDTVITPQEAGWPTLARHAQRQANASLLAESVDALRRYAAQFQEPAHPERAMLGLLEAQLAQLQGVPAAPLAWSRGWAHALMAGSPTVAVEAQLAVAAQQAEPAAAIWVYKRAASSLQALRRSLPEDLPGGGRAFLADHEDALRRFIGLLIDEGRLAEAQEAVRLLREEELHEYTRRSGGRRQAAGQALARTPEEQALDAEADALVAALRPEREASRQRANQRAWVEARYAEGDAPLQAALQRSAIQLDTLLQRAAKPSTSPPLTPAALPAEAPGRLRLRYFLRPEGLDLLASDAQGSRRHLLPLPRAQLHQALHALRSSLLQPGSVVLPQAQALYRALLGPEVAALERARELVIEPDGALRYLPFGVLHDGRRYLAERMSLRIDLGLAPTTPAEPQRKDAPRLLALGSTVGSAELPPLPGVQQELDALRRLRPDASVAQDAGFDLARLRDGLAARPAVVHLASHLQLNAASEAESFLLLGDGQRASLAQLRQLDWQGVHLVLLSACDSGVPSGHGREMAGFASALHQAGARHVLATLWPVSDGATAQWMQGFYAPWQASSPGSLPEPHWLQQAQADWLRRHAGTPLAHPHYWAGFAWLGA